MPNHLSIRAEEIPQKSLSRLCLMLHYLDLGHMTTLAVKEAGNTNICLFQPTGRWKLWRSAEQPTSSICPSYTETMAFVIGSGALGLRWKSKVTGLFGLLPLGGKTQASTQDQPEIVKCQQPESYLCQSLELSLPKQFIINYSYWFNGEEIRCNRCGSSCLLNGFRTSFQVLVTLGKAEGRQSNCILS